MLHLLRRAAKTWAFRLLFALLIVSFAVWGIGDLSIGGGGARVAQVGDRRITVEEFGTALSRELNSLSRRAERPVTLQEARDAGVPQQLLARIVRDAALDEEARRLGLSAGDEELREAILASPSFQGLGGGFDPEAYRFILDRLGFTVERFETDLRRSLARETVAYGVRAGAPAAPGFAEALVAEEFERRAFAVLALPLSAAPEPEAPSETELRAFHEANAEAYRAPERRETVWLEVDPAALAATIAIPEDELRAAYEAAGERYATPERRAVDRLGFETAEAAREAVAAIEAGETTFEALVAERGLAPRDVSLGEIARGDLSGAAGEAVFAADELGPVGPVETALGPALFNLRAILPPRVTPFEAAREDLRAALARDAASETALTRAEEVADLLAAGATLESIAAETGLPLRSAALTRDAADVAAAVVEEAFAAEPGEERDLVETEAGGYVLVRVDAVEEAARQPFEAVEAEVRADALAAARREALAETAAEAETRLADGEAPETVAAGIGAMLERLEPLRRGEALARPDLPAPAVESLFLAEAAGAVAAGPVPEGRAILVLTGIEAADLSDPRAAAALERIETVLADQTGRDLYAYYAAAVQGRVGASVDQEALQQTLEAMR